MEQLTNWEKETQNLAHSFIKQYFDEKADYYWISEEVGGVLRVNDYYWNLKNIVDAIRFKCSQTCLFEWYEHTLKAAMKEEKFQNLQNFAKYGLIDKPANNPAGSN